MQIPNGIVDEETEVMAYRRLVCENDEWRVPRPNDRGEF